MSTTIRGRDSHERVLSDNSPFAVREAFNHIRTNLMYTRKDDQNGNPVYAITSAGESTGKSTVIANLAISYTKINKKVLVIDADMRCPVQNLFFNLDVVDHTGLSEILSSIVNDPCDAIQHTEFKNLDIIPSGVIPPNPSELLLGSRFSSIIEKFRHIYDVIFIDFPPIDIVTDAIATFENITGYIFVIRANQSDSKNVRTTVDMMERLGAKILGIVLNDANIKSTKKSYGSKYHLEHHLENHSQTESISSKKEI